METTYTDTTTKTKKRSAIDIVADRIFDEIEQIVHNPEHPKWERPWAISPDESAPYNLVTNHYYTRSNIFILLITAMAQGYSKNAWLTWNQIQQHEGKVRKGEKGMPILFSKKEVKEVTDPKTGATETKEQWITRYYIVFNVEQVEGLKISPALPEKPNVVVNLPAGQAGVERYEQLIANTGADIYEFETDKAYYHVDDDRIVIPEREQFYSTEGFFATLYHELAHWSGHPSRLNRGLHLPDRTEEQYCFEELVAELTSVLLSFELGYNAQHVFTNSSRYLAHYYELLKENKRAFLSACSLAGKASQYILQFQAP